MAFVKNNLKAIVATFLGAFHFVLMAIPFISVFAKGMEGTESQGASGYKCFGAELGLIEAGGFMKFTLILFLIVAIALLLIGTYLLLISILGDKVNLPSSFGPVSAEKLCGWTHLGYAGTSILVLLAVIIVSIANTQSMDFLGYSVKTGITVGFGVIFGVLLAVGSVVGLWFIEKKNVLGTTGAVATKSRFVCSQCGAAANKESAFCSKCGGKIVEEVPTKPMCTACGAPAKKGDIFCSKCGGKVENIAMTKPVCESCGAPAKDDAVFCSWCGGKIVQR